MEQTGGRFWWARLGGVHEFRGARVQGRTSSGGFGLSTERWRPCMKIGRDSDASRRGPLVSGNNWNSQFETQLNLSLETQSISLSNPSVDHSIPLTSPAAFAIADLSYLKGHDALRLGRIRHQLELLSCCAAWWLTRMRSEYMHSSPLARALLSLL